MDPETHTTTGAPPTSASLRPKARRLSRAWTLSALAIFSAAPADAQWSQESPIPTHLDVRGVAAPTATRVFIATADDSFDDGGALFESADGGATWMQREVPFSLGDPLNGMGFRDDQHGWLFGNANYRTTDGGTTWVELPPLGSTYFMEFYTPTFGLATGNFDRFVSRDAGTSWEPSPDHMFAFDFVDDLIGIGVADSALHRTTDGGTTFTEVLAGDDADAAVFLSGTLAVGIVDNAFVRSTDAGATWTMGVGAEGRSRLTAVSPDVVLAWGRGGSFPDYDDRVLRSADGGQSWTDLGDILGGEVLALTVVDAETVVAADRGGKVFRSADAGQTWTQTFASPGPTPGFLSTVAPVFADAETGYYAFGNGFVIATTDGGASWSQISSGSGQEVTDIDRFPGGDLIACGAGGAILTSTGSSPWVLHESFTSEPLEGVDVIDATQVVVVDRTGRIHRSGDRGATWTSGGAVPSGLNAADLDFTSLLEGWVIGSGFGAGALFHTTDGGESWTAVPDFAGGYVAVDFEGTHGWAANVSGRYYRSTDGGASWIQEELPDFPPSIADMDFFDASIGYAAGHSGYAVRSDDGGVSWQVLPTPSTTDRFTSIHVLGPDELWLTTANDVAYYSANGGQGWAVMEIGSGGFGWMSAVYGTPEGDAWTVGERGEIWHFTGPPPPPLNQPPSASYDFDAHGLMIQLTDTSTDLDGTIVAWEWDFGDSTGSAEQNPTHTFEVADTYTVRLTVTDDDGATDSTIRFIAVQELPGGTFGDFTEVTPLDPLFVTPQNEDFWVATAASADYDGDGDLDIAVFGFYVVYSQSVEERLVLLRNDGQVGLGEWEFAYVDVPLGSLSSGASDMAWGDLDADGDQDLVVGSNGQTVIYRNDAGTLVPTETVLPGYYEDNDQADFDLRSITCADYDNDGDLDLLLPSVYDFEEFEYTTVLMRNDGPDGSGGWIFTEETAADLAGTGHAMSQWADYDGDEDLDLLLVHLAPLTDQGFIRRYRNDGDGVFVGEDILGDISVEHGEAHWGDYDADGDLDVLVAGRVRELDGTYRMALRIYRNDDETYVPIEVIESVSGEGWFDLTAATWADYEADGDMDILLCGNYNSGSQIEGRAQIYVNDGAGEFSVWGGDLPAPRASGWRGGTFSWLDLDQDADLDYFIAGQYFVPGGGGLVDAQMHVYRNDVEGDNVAPTAPEDLVAEVSEITGAVLLSWSPATDDHTPAEALTYDLEVRRSGAPVATPHRLPEPGNISAVQEWALAGLPGGIYTWAVRAVDSAYNGGPVAEGTFNVGGVVDVDPTVSVPQAYALHQNRPNPFNPATTFRFDLPEQSEVQLTAYDAQGRRVARLMDETRPAGSYALRWDATDLASGTYFVRLTSGGFTRTITVQLLK